ncbi:hypothetical protein BD410DRAFT_717327 [Rickenella mellea]|uniref:Peptidase A2 domain-containing protein n=1 Tax=Rickenella mellea TaxID=50990 RepID=A0A4Y7QFR0_9AGAM|nr:hypothetical protein BD410DRAFT_717327 [Rickenella mellea]
MQPTRDPQSQRLLTAYVLLNGHKAFTMFDSGSNTDAVSPDFAHVAKLDVVALDDPVTLQLGCKGSRSRIQFGVNTTLCFGPISETAYLDVANIDRYDLILGTPFLTRHSIVLDFLRRAVVTRGVKVPCFSSDQDSSVLPPLPVVLRKSAKQPALPQLSAARVLPLPV